MTTIQHSPSEATLLLPTTTRAPGTARELVAAHAAALPVEMRETAVLLVSELVTNAVLHGGPRITLHVIASADYVRVEVHDRGLPMTARAGGPVDPAQSGGRGLNIVEAMATRWGVTVTARPRGKHVWFELGTTTIDSVADAQHSA